MSETEEKKVFTWNDLVKFAKTLSSDQLKQPVNVIIDDNSYGNRVTSAECLPNDIYVNKEDPEDCGSLEDVKNAYTEEEWQEVKDDYELGTPAGFPFLYSSIDF